MTDLKKQTVEQLKKQTLDLKKEQMNLRFQKATGQMEKPNRWREVRKMVARVKTELSARQNAAAAK